ncbi:1-acyl-sn-glycerol-3-phosphate acyltransferase [Synechococcus elongatus]|uniref:lysophospholipid acyltransferase family protein n=1 Tax=Synechococcus elongatus TaxID=32046 RepID=UPI0030CF1905
MPHAIVQQAQPALRFIPPDYQPWLHRVVKTVLPMLLRSHGIQRVETTGVEELAQRLAQFQSRQARLILAFRHPSTQDPLVLAHLLWKTVPTVARRNQIPLRSPVHSQFLYDRGIPIWAGQLTGWVLSKLGGIPIQRGKLDRLALKTARDCLVNGDFPLAIAPEGATNNHSEILSPLEPGIAQLAFWCCDDLAEANRSEAVFIIPISLQYPFVDRQNWAVIDRLFNDLEQQLKLPKSLSLAIDHPGEKRYARLARLGLEMLTMFETFYREAYGQSLAVDSAKNVVEKTAYPDFATRLQRLREMALSVAESHFNLPAKGTISDRCRRIEQAGWDRIYRDDLEQLSPVARGLADWNAMEASIRMGHMRLVEQFAAVSGSYVREKPSIDRYAEVLTIIARAIAWIQDRNPQSISKLGQRIAKLQIGQPINVSDRYLDYRKSRRSAIEQLTADLQTQLEQSIKQ